MRLIAVLVVGLLPIVALYLLGRRVGKTWPKSGLGLKAISGLLGIAGVILLIGLAVVTADMEAFYRMELCPERANFHLSSATDGVMLTKLKLEVPFASAPLSGVKVDGVEGFQIVADEAGLWLVAERQLVTPYAGINIEASGDALERIDVNRKPRASWEVRDGYYRRHRAIENASGMEKCN
jgi:hypothetical protein